MLVCVVWHDGSTWRAALDSSQLHETEDTDTDVDSPPVATTPCPGRLAASPALTDFFAERQFGTLSPGDSCNYAVNIFDDGALLSIVTDSSPHGADSSSPCVWTVLLRLRRGGGAWSRSSLAMCVTCVVHWAGRRRRRHTRGGHRRGVLSGRRDAQRRGTGRADHQVCNHSTSSSMAFFIAIAIDHNQLQISNGVVWDGLSFIGSASNARLLLLAMSAARSATTGWAGWRRAWG